jgi:peptidoglycan/xylan/chitin deacetylase (PgdA/CDA1 family)
MTENGAPEFPERRKFLAVIGLSTLSAALWGGKPAPANALEVPSTPPKRLIYKRDSIIYRLPRSRQRRMAWTVDDGTNVVMINNYVKLAQKHDLRITFFVYSGMSGWRKLAPKIKPLVESGQIQIANHTARHPDLTQLSTHQIQKELWDCHKFILKHYGIDARPFFRPPYGAVNHHVVKAAAAIGYTSPVMWSGTLADATRISTSGIWNNAKQYIGNEVILLAHANSTQTARVFGKILNRVRYKRLKLVTLNDALAPAPKPPSVVHASLSSSAISVTWSAVTNAQFYDVQYLESGVLQHVRVTGRSHQFTNLPAGHSYSFRVVASVFGVKSKPSVYTAPVRIDLPEPDPDPTLTP